MVQILSTLALVAAFAGLATAAPAAEVEARGWDDHGRKTVTVYKVKTKTEYAHPTTVYKTKTITKQAWPATVTSTVTADPVTVTVYKPGKPWGHKPEPVTVTVTKPGKPWGHKPDTVTVTATATVTARPGPPAGGGYPGGGYPGGGAGSGGHNGGEPGPRE